MLLQSNCEGDTALRKLISSLKTMMSLLFIESLREPTMLHYSIIGSEGLAPTAGVVRSGALLLASFRCRLM